MLHVRNASERRAKILEDSSSSTLYPESRCSAYQRRYLGHEEAVIPTRMPNVMAQSGNKARPYPKFVHPEKRNTAICVEAGQFQRTSKRLGLPQEGP